MLWNGKGEDSGVPWLEAVARGAGGAPRRREDGHPEWLVRDTYLAFIGLELEVGVERGGKNEESWQSLSKSRLGQLL